MKAGGVNVDHSGDRGTAPLASPDPSSASQRSWQFSSGVASAGAVGAAKKEPTPLLRTRIARQAASASARDCPYVSLSASEDEEGERLGLRGGVERERESQSAAIAMQGGGFSTRQGRNDSFSRQEGGSPFLRMWWSCRGQLSRALRSLPSIRSIFRSGVSSFSQPVAPRLQLALRRLLLGIRVCGVWLRERKDPLKVLCYTGLLLASSIGNTISFK